MQIEGQLMIDGLRYRALREVVGLVGGRWRRRVARVLICGARAENSRTA